MDDLHFTLSDKEVEAIKNYRKTHDCPKQHKYQGAIGISKMGYKIMGTSLGTIIKVFCPLCEYEEDVTDYSMW